jgi:hypothetical protein
VHYTALEQSNHTIAHAQSLGSECDVLCVLVWRVHKTQIVVLTPYECITTIASKEVLAKHIYAHNAQSSAIEGIDVEGVYTDARRQGRKQRSFACGWFENSVEW